MEENDVLKTRRWLWRWKLFLALLRKTVAQTRSACSLSCAQSTSTMRITIGVISFWLFWSVCLMFVKKGIDGNKGELADMAALGLWEPMAVRAQTIKTAVEAASLLLRVDDILSGGMPKQQQQQDQGGQPHPEDGPMGEE